MSPESEIKRRIRKHGKITFAEFIEIALYWSHGGYYTVRGPIGAEGDYYTSPLAHPVFGALLSVQLFQMWREMGRPIPFTILELGAGNGILCRDIVNYAKELPSNFSDAIRYICLDRRTRETLETKLSSTDRVLADGLPFKKFTGCILSNEYLDAFPVHQIMMTKTGLKEVYIGLEDDNLMAFTGVLSQPGLARRFNDLNISLAEGQVAEVNLALDTWAQGVSNSLYKGFILTIDYGQIAHDLYDPDVRMNGTLVTYHKHTQTDSPLTMIGSQDITSQVDFTSVRKSGEKAGLNTLGLVTQREFLSNLGITNLQRRLFSQKLSHREMQANQAGMLDLIKPDGLGNFKILSHGKNVDTSKLWGIERSEEAFSLVENLPVPLLTDQHLTLLDGWTFGRGAGFETLWPVPESESLD